MGLSVIILAAGQGTRMKSRLPKVMHPLGGRPLLEHVYEAAAALPDADIHVVYGHGGERVLEELKQLVVRWVLQAEQLGTGHAVRQAMPAVPATDTVLILYGDVPLITVETLQHLLKSGRGSGFGLLTAEVGDPTGYGRILRDAQGRVVRIVEQRDCGADEAAVREINTGMMAVSASLLKGWLDRIGNQNAQGEYYLTDIVALAVADGVTVNTVAPASIFEIMGVNTRSQLAELERHFQMLQAQFLMREGVTFLDPCRFDLRGRISTGRDVEIDVNVVLEGDITIGDGVRIGPNNHIRDTTIGDGAIILANCVIEGAVIGAGARVGPFARIRPDTRLAPHVHVGNFVEIKKSTVGDGSKINHLSYVGDAEVGSRVNVGAGTITCNYDGANKHKTIIGDDVFIGSDTQLIAPVAVGDGATIGAGTTLTDNAPPGQLTVGRARQRTVAHWKRPEKKR